MLPLHLAGVLPSTCPLLICAGCQTCLEMLTVGWRPAPRTAGLVPVLQELPHTCPTQQHTGPMAPRTLFAVCLGCQCGRCLGKMSRKGDSKWWGWESVLEGFACEFRLLTCGSVIPSPSVVSLVLHVLFPSPPLTPLAPGIWFIVTTHSVNSHCGKGPLRKCDTVARRQCGASDSAQWARKHTLTLSHVDQHCVPCHCEKLPSC